jgi:transcriptional regulator with XRE-family HTH domain
MRHKNMTARSAQGNPSPKAARTAKGLSQRALATLVPTSQMTVWKCENEARYPKHRALRAAYLAALGLTEKATA